MGVKISIIVSVFNEEAVINMFYVEIKKELEKIGHAYEIIFVNDGSSDRSIEFLKALYEEDNSIIVVNFSRNFGHESAMLAGIENASGDILICMDADLQHPPSEIKNIVAKYFEGYEVVNMVREHRADAGFISRITSKYFYKLLNKISSFKIEPNASDFFMISSRIAKILYSNFRDRNRFLRGFIQQVGFKKTTIAFNAPERAGGTSKYNFLKLLVFSISVIVSNSRAPLRFSIFISLLFTFFSFALGVYSIIMKLHGNPFSGYTTIIVFLSFAFSLLFLVIGVLGEYIGNLYNEIKVRPHYIVENILKHE